jgi:hypothetical protein
MYSKLATTAALALGLVSAQAAFHFDFDPINVELNGTTTSYADTFDITGPGLGKGYDPSTMTIDWAFATFKLWDWTGSETVTIDLGGTPFTAIGPFLGDVLLGDEVVGSVLLDLDADGKVGYSVNRLNGSFKLVSAELHAKSYERAVPDSGWTLALLGLSLAGMAKLRRF